MSDDAILRERLRHGDLEAFSKQFRLFAVEILVGTN